MKRFGAIIIACLVALTVAAQPDLKKLDAYYAKALSDWGVPGMSIAIVKDGKVVFSKGYGVKEAGKPEKTDEHTLYAIASNSKAFTTAAIAMMAKEGKLSLDDKVRKFLPYFELYDPYISQDVTVRDLLCHRIGHGTFSGDAIWYLSDNLTSEQIIRRAKYIPQAYNFRAGYGYTNVMYIAAGELMKEVAGKPWGNIIEEKIFTPLGMSHSLTSSRYLSQKSNYASPHALAGEKHTPIPWEDWDAIAATGGIVSSVSDMAKWMIFNLNNGINGKDTLLTPQLRNTLWTPHNMFTVDHTDKDFDTHFRGYGLGWGLSDYKGKMRVGHTGGYSGMVSIVALIPDEKLGVVVLTNGMKGGLMNAIANYTIDAYLKAPVRDWSAELLALAKKRQAGNDARISDRVKAHVEGTKPSVAIEKYTGTYYADMYGNIEVKKEGDKLRLYFEHSKRFNATLTHWHYDVWKIEWDEAEALSWFTFGTVQFKLDNNLTVTELEFDVPNDDIWFYELKPKKVK
ncbi:MAG: serine hydrolase [Cyclobacteriaceae bacterium]|nr:serine hydrolase [Cyclobacteriaceae bacterium]